MADRPHNDDPTDDAPLEELEELDRLLAEETRRIQADTSSQTQLLQDATILLGDQPTTLLADPTGAVADEDPVTPATPAAPTQALDASRVPDPTAEATELLAPAPDDLTQVMSEPADQPAEDDPDPDDETLIRRSEHVGLIPLTDTMLLPVQLDDERLGIRNTRDYDHDAQSANVVTSTGKFGTIHEEHSSRDARRDARRDPYARSARRGDVLGEGNSRSKLRPLLAILLVALVLGGGAAVLGYGMELWGGKTVPSVIGESQAIAEERIREKGLEVRVEAEPADDAIGKVLDQQPDAGERLEEGGEVTIVVATNRTVPEVIGLYEADARAALEAAGAELITTETKPSSAAEGTVIDVSPAVGEPFVSRSPVTLTLAGPYTVPDVIGKKESDAVDALKAEGLNAEVSYIKSDQTVRTVVETTPAPGETIAEGGTVQVRVSSPYPTDIHHLAEFFDHSSQDVDSFLQSKGYKLDTGLVDNHGNALATYLSQDQGNLTFSSQPYSRSISLPKKDSSNVLSTGVPIAGVRLDCPSGLIPQTIDRAGVEQLASECGLTGQSEFCDNASMTLPAGATQTAATFACVSGKMGDLVWTALVVGGSGSTRAVVTCAKEGLYPAADLQTFSGSVSKFEVYQEVYLSPEYQVKEEKKEEKHDQEQSEGEGAASGEGEPEGE